VSKAIAATLPGLTAPARSSPFECELVALMPQLRNFSYSVCRNRTLAEDMAQQALMKAWSAQDSFRVGTNLKAWLFTILRNEFYSQRRRAWRETHLDTAASEQIPAAVNEQGWVVELSDTSRALAVLPQTQQDALLLVALGGFSFQEAADLCGTPIGTVKSRVTRARYGLTKVLDGAKTLPRRVAGRGASASDDILSQLSALSAASSAHAVARQA